MRESHVNRNHTNEKVKQIEEISYEHTSYHIIWLASYEIENSFY